MELINLIKDKKEIFSQFYCGLERETLRISKNGKLSQYSHPIQLGSALTHPYFGTDFGEAQLEWNTPPFSSFSKVKNFLQDLITYTIEVNPTELFWPYSMPCPLKEQVTLARYGTSYKAQKKELYRKGLCYRYGKNLQMISGIHFNFSFSSSFWDFLYDTLKPLKTKQEFINNSYFKIIRKFLHEGWLLTYLFGASPAMHKTYVTKIPKGFKTQGSTIYHPHATSIRMSSLGYYTRIQNQLSISFENLETYLKDLEFAISTPYPGYQKIGLKKNGEPIQLNLNFLQIENEHYSRIRPKQGLHKGETPLFALKNRGVEYLEIRSIDIDPFAPLGVSNELLLFLHQFLLYCLVQEDLSLNEEVRYDLIENQQHVSLQGRKKGLQLKDSHLLTLETWAKEIFHRMKPIAECLDHTNSNNYINNLLKQQSKIDHPHLTPSAQILEELKSKSLEAFSLKWAKSHRKSFNPISNKKKKYFHETVQSSIKSTQALETASEILLEGYENLELSTQILMKEALKLGIQVEVLDSTDNLIRLKKGSHIEYVKQATKTSQDSYIVPHLMGNKYITKKILKQHGFSVPNSQLYHSLKEAQNDYFRYEKKKIVIKPNSTNFGIGIAFVNPHDKQTYLKALDEAFSHSHSCLVENYHTGKEYRFLIINSKVEGIIHRIPAHIIGDGIHTIKELVYLKNHDPSFYRNSKTYLSLTKVEKEMLQLQNLTIHSIPRKRKKILLRKNSNVSTGGDAIDVTDNLHRSYLKIATKATKIIGSKICGVDILISSPKKPATQKNHSIIELNYNPVLFFHAFPNKGKKRNVAKPILQCLGF